MLALCLSMLDEEEDRHSFENLYFEHKQGMYAVAYGILCNKEDAEDAVQNAFISIAKNFKKIKSIKEQELKPFVTVIVRNYAINIYNANKRRVEKIVEYNDYVTSVDIDFFEKYDYEKLVSVISALPVIYRDIIFLHYVYGFSPKEIGNMLDAKVETIWKRIERGKKKLREALETQEGM